MSEVQFSERLFVRIDPELLEAANEAASKDGRSLGDWVRRALRGCVGLPVTGPKSTRTRAKKGRSANNRSPKY